MPKITLSTGKSFSSSSSMSILDAAAQSNIFLPYSCKIGRCNTCKCKILSGKTLTLKPELGLSEQEKANGWVLSCVRLAETDAVIEVEDLGNFALPISRTWPCRINEIKHLTSDIIQVKLRLHPSANFQFIEGQYVDIVGPNSIQRSYSIANANSKNEILELNIRYVPNGIMSNYWFRHAKFNDLLRLRGPLGTFFLRETTDTNLIFLATGTGISPVKAMLEAISHLSPPKKPRSVTVLWGGRYSNDFYLDFSGIPGNFKYIPVQSQASRDWTGAKGYVQDVLMSLSPDLENSAVYACGSKNMIHSAKTCLVEAGLNVKRFYADAFVNSGAD